MRNLKRALSLAMASVMLFGMMVVGSSAASYPDVDANDNLEAIEVLKMVGVMEGDEKGNFNPDKMVTRNEMAVVMVNLLGLTAGGTSPFTDVPNWAQPYVAACYNNDIIAGVSKTEFNGDANVTAVQAGLMVMKALGYFGYQGEFGDSWKLAVVKQADKIDLYRGVNAYTDQDMSRNNVAKMVLNALECTVQVVTEEGGLNVSGEGMTVTEKPTYKYENAKNRDDWDYAGTSAGYEGLRETLQLCEKLYGKDLKKNTSKAIADDFGRPATEWTYKGDSVKNPKAPTLTYTAEVKGKTIYADLGQPTLNASGSDKTTFNCTMDGDTGTFTINDIAKNQDAKGDTKDGTVTEVYWDSSENKLDIISYNYYLAKADEDYDEDDEELTIDLKSDKGLNDSKLSLDDFAAIKDMAEDDYMVVTLAKNGTKYDVKSVIPADMIEDAVVSKARAEDYVVADGTEYSYNAVAATSGSDALGVDLMTGNGYDLNGDGYNLYLDPNGYVLGVEGYDSGVKLDDYLFVKETGDSAFDTVAKALFMDGTTKTITVDKVDDSDTYTWTDDAIAGKFYKFDTDKDGNYELTKVAETTTGTEVEQGKQDSTTIDSGAKPIAGVSKAGTSNTVFIAKDKVFTGVKNAPKVNTASTVYYMTNDDGRLMAVYTPTKGSSSTSSDDVVFVLSNKPAKAKDGDDTYYVYDVIMNGEKTTLDANQNSKDVGVYILDTYTDGRADLGDRVTGTKELVTVLGDISAQTPGYKDGTLTLGTDSYILSDDIEIFTIDGRTVDTVSPSGVKRAVTDDGFKYAAVVEVDDNDDDILTVYLSKDAIS